MRTVKALLTDRVTGAKEEQGAPCYKAATDLAERHACPWVCGRPNLRVIIWGIGKTLPSNTRKGLFGYVLNHRQ